MLEKQEPAKPVTPDPEPETPKFTAEIPKEEELRHEARDKETEQAGSPTGSDIGVPEGMDIGVEGGVVGGVPGGVLGGVIGGTGDGVGHGLRPGSAPDQDHPAQVPAGRLREEDRRHGRGRDPHRLHGTRGQGARGRARSRPWTSAALDTVEQWVFSPAIKNGRPVATVASAPVTFRIF